jgi:N-carbamoylputrescine amidase
MNHSVTVGLIQMRCSAEPEANLAKALAMTREAAAQGAQVICLPELFRSRYFCQTEDYACFELAEPVPGPSTEAFAALAKELNLTVIVSLFERRAPGLYHNTAAVVEGARGYIGKYRKMHIPDDPRYYEKFYFTPGDLGFKSFATDQAQLGVLVCWDQWYPEAARLTPGGKGRVRRAPARCLGTDPARACGRQRLLRRCGQPHRF